MIMTGCDRQSLWDEVAHPIKDQVCPLDGGLVSNSIGWVPLWAGPSGACYPINPKVPSVRLFFQEESSVLFI